jgi:hypothetical protein
MFFDIPEFLKLLSKERMEQLRLHGVPLPNLNKSRSAFELINLHRLDEMLPGLLVGSFCVGDFLYAYLSPYLIEKE